MFKKIVVFGLLYFTLNLTGFCFTEEIIERIENSTYGEIYPQESIAERLRRLETDFFGMEQTGSLDSRLEMLSKMQENSKNIASYPSYHSDYSVRKRNPISDFFNKFVDSGVITGFIPPVNTSYCNGSYYESYGNHSNYGNNLLDDFFRGSNNPHQYHPSLHKNHYIGHGYFNNENLKYKNPMVNRYRNHKHYFNDARNRTAFNNYNRRINKFYAPPNIQTRSTVTIIKD